MAKAYPKPSTIALLLLALLTFSFAAENIIDTENGQVQGILESNYRAFLGIPYTAPPVGDLRFAPPAPVKSWAPAIYNATTFKAGCPQFCELPPNTCPETFSEDCIYLNIFTPRASELSQPQPVYVYLPGGHFQQGSAGVSLYYASRFVARTGIIMVTISYRLGALGWATDESRGLTGNYGLLDQRAALLWIKKNIAAFGGDPNNVILTGQSAGGTSTTAHMVAPASEGLFHKVVIQSMGLTLHMKNSTEASVIGSKFMSIVGCEDRACLLTKTTDEIVKAQYTASRGGISWDAPLTTLIPWTPTVDGKEIPQAALNAFQDGNYARVPTIIGTLAEDFLLFAYKAMNKTLEEPLYRMILDKIFHQYSSNVSKLYPGSDSPTGDRREIISVLGSDYIYHGVSRYNLALIKKQNPTLGVYNFIVNHPLSFDAWGPKYQCCVGHSCHGGEIPLFIQPPLAVEMFSPEEVELSNQIIDYLGNFARTGNPNKGSAMVAPWPEVDNDTYPYMEFKTPMGQASNNFKRKYLDFFDTIGYNWGWTKV